MTDFGISALKNELLRKSSEIQLIFHSAKRTKQESRIVISSANARNLAWQKKLDGQSHL